MKKHEKKRFDLQTPSQILQNHPKIAVIFDCRELGYLRLCKVVDGKKLSRGCLISESDLLDFLEWRFGMTEV